MVFLAESHGRAECPTVVAREDVIHPCAFAHGRLHPLHSHGSDEQPRFLLYFALDGLQIVLAMVYLAARQIPQALVFSVDQRPLQG